MKKFQFSLQKVLDVRLVEEKILQKELALAILEQKKAEEKAKTIKTTIANEWQRGGNMVKTTVSSSQMMLHYEYLKSLKQQYLKQQNYIGLAISNKNKAKQKLTDKAKERKTLEILKENKLQEYKKQRKHFEQSFFDEVAQGAKLRQQKLSS